VNESKYSRIPVYDETIDRITGVVLSKSLLDHLTDPQALERVKVKDAMEPTYFVPETMTVWNVLEEMRKRRLHMAIGMYVSSHHSRHPNLA
jgi:putative hemolysin